MPVGVENDVLAHADFPAEQWMRIESGSQLERTNGEIDCRTDVLGGLPEGDFGAIWLVGAVLMESTVEQEEEAAY